ncbi:MAG: patatin-like phospholipase family protein [Marinilabiliaceae bacterium]
MNKTPTLIALALLLTTNLVTAQTDHPRVGLVLSGGGAKGLAHIGVLKVLEEEGIRPDFIAGTSMGSIIGGLYAIGYNSAELDSIVRHVDWARLLSDEIPLSSVSSHEKEEYKRYQAEFTMTRDGLKIPSGLIRGQQISDMLTSLSWHKSDVQNFDELPIPFRCVAADLKSGEEYIFSEGDLTTAMRASMSIPTVFSPVRKDSLLLVDGGVLNNFPVKICRDMGADIIIGVNVGFKDKTGEDIHESFTEILMAAATISGNVSTREAIRQTDLLIAPKLPDFSMGSFSDNRKIIQIGEDAAREKIEELRSLIDSAGIPSRDPIQVDKTRNRKVQIGHIRANGLKNINKHFLLSNLGIQEGDTITPALMTGALRQVMGTRHFENITYRLEPAEGSHNLVLDVEESPRAKAKFSIHYDNEYKAGLLTNVTGRNFLGKSSRSSLSFDISENPQFGVSQINFLGGKQMIASKIKMEHENNNFPIYLENGSKYGTFEHQYTTFRGGFMTALGTRWEMESFARYSISTLRNKSGFSDIFYADVEHFGNAFLTSSFDFTYNSLDSRYFPKRGAHFELNYDHSLDVKEEYEGGDKGREMVSSFTHVPNKNYFSLVGNYRKYFPLNSHLTAGLRLSGRFTSRSIPLMDFTFLGGLPFNNRSKEVHFIGYSFREKLADNFALGEVDLRARILKQVHISAIGGFLLSETNLPEVIEPIGLDKNEQVYEYGLIVAYDSFLGPVQAGLGSNNTDSRLRWYFNFGINF